MVLVILGRSNRVEGNKIDDSKKGVVKVEKGSDKVEAVVSQILIVTDSFVEEPVS